MVILSDADIDFRQNMLIHKCVYQNVVFRVEW